jgi:post-segregation antitoxin (ccd killing protein)
MNHDGLKIERKVTMTVSCPLELFSWLKETQRNMSVYVVRAIEAERQREKQRLEVSTDERKQ